MWSDRKAFIQFKNMDDCYVTLANNFKVPIKGQGTIQLNIHGYILQLHNVSLVPSLQFSLYSVKQHRKYIHCSCIFDNTAASLNFPKFSFTINDDYDMLMYGKSIPRKSKIHWSSRDGQIPSLHQTSVKNTHPIPIPSLKPNPNKQVHRKITNIYIHKYLGFRTLKSLKPFKIVCKNNISFVDAGEIPPQSWQFYYNTSTQK